MSDKPEKDKPNQEHGDPNIPTSPLMEGQNQNKSDERREPSSQLEDNPKPTRWFRFRHWITSSRSRWVRDWTLVGVNAGLAITTYFLWRLASIQADSAQENFRLENRPWVGVQQGEIDADNILKATKMKFVLQNYGKTPANHVLTHIDFFYSITNNPTQAFPPLRKSTDPWQSASMIPPSQTISISSTIDTTSPSNREQFRKISRNEGWLFVQGVICYTDIFKGQDTTRFCAYYDTRFDAFTFYRDGNEMK